MVTPSYVPERGDLIWLDFDPQSGHEQAGRRPALVLSPSSYNRLLSLALVCPVTSRRKEYLWEIELPPGLPVSGFVLSDQVRSLDWRARRADYIAALAPDPLAQALTSARRLLE